MLLTNGRIHTMDAAGSVVDSLVIRAGRVAFAGRRGDINPAPREPTLDLGGRAVLPGLVDGHGHLMLLARARLELNLATAGSEDEIAQMVAAAAARLRPGQWISGRGWDQTRWPGQAYPGRASLDRAAPGHPVALIRVDGHATWASGEALTRAGITRHSSDPPGGLITKDANGEPTGILIDLAQDIIRSLVPAPAEERFDQAVRETMAECLAKGLTGAHEPGLDLSAVASYTRLIERGQFPFRVFAALSGKKAWARYRDGAPETVGDGRLVVGAVKLWLDGALGSRGAALHSPYCDDPANTGLVRVPPEDVERLTREVSARGFHVWVHAIGDRANTMVLDVFERVRAVGGPQSRLRVEHAQILTPADMPRFARLGVVPSMQPTHCTSDMRWAGERLGPERLAGAYAWRSVLDAGAYIAGGSDFPVEDANPFHGLHAAVTRRPREGDDPGWQPAQRMTREEAVRSFTIWNARSIGLEADQGSLEAGKRADLIALSDDVFTCAEEKIAGLAPVLTMVGGAVAYAVDQDFGASRSASRASSAGSTSDTSA
ncbi:MAG TPA: amidohydrolase [Candidatus Acidoferrum sp.]|nr:amidohydrolase [Candidatus Acidoferrum sp.]